MTPSVYVVTVAESPIVDDWGQKMLVFEETCLEERVQISQVNLSISDQTDCRLRCQWKHKIVLFHRQTDACHELLQGFDGSTKRHECDKLFLVDAVMWLFFFRLQTLFSRPFSFSLWTRSMFPVNWQISLCSTPPNPAFSRLNLLLDKQWLLKVVTGSFKTFPSSFLRRKWPERVSNWERRPIRKKKGPVLHLVFTVCIFCWNEDFQHIDQMGGRLLCALSVVPRKQNWLDRKVGGHVLGMWSRFSVHFAHHLRTYSSADKIDGLKRKVIVRRGRTERKTINLTNTCQKVDRKIWSASWPTPGSAAQPCLPLQ